MRRIITVIAAIAVLAAPAAASAQLTAPVRHEPTSTEALVLYDTLEDRNYQLPRPWQYVAQCYTLLTTKYHNVTYGMDAFTGYLAGGRFLPHCGATFRYWGGETLYQAARRYYDHGTRFYYVWKQLWADKFRTNYVQDYWTIGPDRNRTTQTPRSVVWEGLAKRLIAITKAALQHGTLPLPDYSAGPAGAHGTRSAGGVRGQRSITITSVRWARRSDSRGVGRARIYVYNRATQHLTVRKGVHVTFSRPTWAKNTTLSYYARVFRRVSFRGVPRLFLRYH